MKSFKLNIEDTLNRLLEQEDTDGDKKITIEDRGPKMFKIEATDGKPHEVGGTYHLSNLMQELVIQKQQGKTVAEIQLSAIEESPVTRISRMIRNSYWNGLTRRMDKSGLEALISDTKNESLTTSKLPVYLPASDALAYKYYKALEKELPIKTVSLPKVITPLYVKSINHQPGILSLKLENVHGEITGVPFVVPGGRFNEMYGWDSYFESVGLIIDGRVELAKAMADNFQYEIEHYGKILNANRSYYLTRTQPPFYSSLIREVFEVTQDRKWLRSHLETAIKEYETVWMERGKRLTGNGLNRYLAEGIGMPPECETGHFDAVLQPYAAAEGLSIDEFIQRYQSDNPLDSEDNPHAHFKCNPDLDAYFVHDRSMRESGHDTSYRLEGRCADLNLVELNDFLYKYEKDFAFLIAQHFNDSFKFLSGKAYTSAYWIEKAKHRQTLAKKYLWNAEKGMYFDYDFRANQPSDFISATTFAPLWSEMATKEQAELLVKNALPVLKEKGGIAGSTEKSRGDISAERPARQWDYPNGWAPHQMLIWKGLFNYGYRQEAQELIYRWIYMITRNAVDYNGTIPEKYDVVAATHKVFAEYGNVGTDFEYITQEGFGWMNASYQYGISLLEEKDIENLNQLVSPEELF